MATSINPLDDIVTLITDNYNTANTDNKSVTVSKIYEQPKIFDLNNDFVLVYSQLSNPTPVGIGTGPYRNVTESFRIDIRIGSTTTSDLHARKVLTEIQRILATNVTNPSSNFQLLNPNWQITDLSDKTRKIFRYVLDVTLEAYNRDLTI